ncbi:MAG: OmpA family protein [Campylobacterales bacterium]|nr:OmpA family protein [Campylobacterales bacterium]
MKKNLFIWLLVSGLAFANTQDYKDLDNDLVIDTIDKCPNTPQGVFVDEDGCTKTLKFSVNFDSDSDLIEKEFLPIVNDVLKLAFEGYGYDIYILGHTDSISTNQYNMELSKKRAQRLKSIISSFDIDLSRVHIHWYGESQPIATNVTSDGRYLNRRVEIFLK